MPKPLFHSFYNDKSLASIKHALLYYGEIAIPTDTFISVYGDENKHCNYVQLLHEKMDAHLNFLENEGYVELITMPQGQDMLMLNQAISTNIGAKNKVYNYKDVLPIFESLDLNIDNSEHLQVANQVSNHLAATCLASIVKKGYLPCVDNVIISDLIASGLESISKTYNRNLSSYELKQLSSRLFAQQVYKIALPTFDFSSFHDVLELRQRLSCRLINLNSCLLEISSNLTCHPWEDNFNEEVKKSINKNIIPEINALREHAKFSLTNVAKEITGAAIIVSLQSVLPETLAMGLIGGGYVAANQAIINEKKRGDALLNNNAFGVLLEINKSIDS